MIKTTQVNSVNAQWLGKNKNIIDWRSWQPKRGDVYLINFGEGLGSEQKFLRPAVVVSNDINNKFSTVINAAPITSASKKRLPVHVQLDINDGMKIDNSIICIEQTRCVSKERALINNNIIKLAQLNKERMEEVDIAIKIQFGLV